MYNTTYNSLQTFTFTVGWTTAEQAFKILHETKKIDPNSFGSTAPTGTMINGERVSKTIFQFIAKHSTEKELFFKLRLQYATFELCESYSDAVLTGYNIIA